MMRGLFFTIILFQCCFSSSILLRDVEVVTGFKDKMTQGRRFSPVEQLFCQGFHCSHVSHAVSSIQCKNSGFNGKDVEWRCEAANMPDGYDLDTTIVSCEGFDHPKDPYILQGSCGIEYTIKRSIKYAQNIYPRGPKGATWSDFAAAAAASNVQVVQRKDSSDEPVAMFGLFVGFICVCIGALSFLICICSSCCCVMCKESERRQNEEEYIESDRASRRRLRAERRAAEAESEYAPAPVHHHHYEEPRKRSYSEGYVDAKIDSWLWNSTPVKETVVVNNPVPDPVFVERHSSSTSSGKHTSVSHGTTRRR